MTRLLNPEMVGKTRAAIEIEVALVRLRVAPTKKNLNLGTP